MLLAVGHYGITRGAVGFWTLHPDAVPSTSIASLCIAADGICSRSLTNSLTLVLEPTRSLSKPFPTLLTSSESQSWSNSHRHQLLEQ